MVTDRKLNYAEYVEARQARDAGVAYKEIAATHRLSIGSVSNLVNGKTYADYHARYERAKARYRKMTETMRRKAAEQADSSVCVNSTVESRCRLRGVVTKLLKRTGLTYTGLAAQIGCDVSDLVQWHRGTTAPTDAQVDTVESFACRVLH